MFTALFNAFDFHGRANRGEYWSFVLFAFVLQLFAGSMIALTSASFAASSLAPARDVAAIINITLSLFLLIPSLSVTIRRLHDSNRTGWWALLSVPLITVNAGRMITPGNGTAFLMLAAICAGVQIIFMLLPGTDGRNRFDSGNRELKRIRLGDGDGSTGGRRSTIAFTADAAAILWPSASPGSKDTATFGKRS